MAKKNALTRREIVIGIAVPLAVAAIGALVVFLAPRNAPPRPPGVLTLESVRIDPGSEPATRFGEWMMLGVSTSDFKRILRDSAVRDYMSEDENWSYCNRLTRLDLPFGDFGITLDTNAVGVRFYYADWRYHERIPGDWKETVERMLPNWRQLFPESELDARGDDWQGDAVSDTARWCEALNGLLGEAGKLVKPPVFEVVLRNNGVRPVTIQSFTATPLRSYGGEADAGGSPIEAVGELTELPVRFDSTTSASLKPQISLDLDKTTMLRVRLYVVDAAQGDGPGELVFRLTARYFDGDVPRELFIGNFLMADNLEALTAFPACLDCPNDKDEGGGGIIFG